MLIVSERGTRGLGSVGLLEVARLKVVPS